MQWLCRTAVPNWMMSHLKLHGRHTNESPPVCTQMDYLTRCFEKAQNLPDCCTQKLNCLKEAAPGSQQKPEQITTSCVYQLWQRYSKWQQWKLCVTLILLRCQTPTLHSSLLSNVAKNTHRKHTHTHRYVQHLTLMLACGMWVTLIQIMFGLNCRNSDKSLKQHIL